MRGGESSTSFVISYCKFPLVTSARSGDNSGRKLLHVYADDVSSFQITKGLELYTGDVSKRGEKVQAPLLFSVGGFL